MSNLENDAALPAKFVAGIAAHINEDHRNEMLLLAHRLAGQTWATDAALQNADKNGVELKVMAGERVALVRVAFEQPIDKTTDFRPAMQALLMRAHQT